MAITKKFLKTKPICKVTFSYKGKVKDGVCVVGTFNKWKSNELVMKQLRKNYYEITIRLQQGKNHEFRYIVDGVYTNDPSADGYKWNNYAAAENCLLKT